MNIDPVSAKRLYQSVVSQFIGLITAGQLKPGDKLPPERELAERFAVSRPSIREAFRALEIIGLIEVRPGGGTYITDLNMAPFITLISPLFFCKPNAERELLEFRQLIETEAVRLASAQQLPQGMAALRGAIGDMERALEQYEPGKGADADIRFHQAIFQCSENAVLNKVAECVFCFLENSVRFNRAVIIKDIRQSQQLLDQHRLILQAIESGQDLAAAQAMSDHLRFAHDCLTAGTHAGTAATGSER